MINQLNCRQITTQLQEIHLKREQYGAAIGERNFPEAFNIQSELTKLIDQLKKELKPVFNIEGKEFPVFSLVIGGKDKEQLKAELEEISFKISKNAQALLDSHEFTTLENPEEISLVRLKVCDLGFSDNATTDQIYARVKELGLELCPAEVGPHQRLKEKEQPLGDCYRIAMKQIADSASHPDVFSLVHDKDGLWLSVHWSNPTDEWDPDDEFMFRLPPDSKVEPD